MLNKYNFPYKETTNQILIIDSNGIIVDLESTIFNNSIGTDIKKIHPFFNTIILLLSKKNTSYTFECINLEIENINYTIDATLHNSNPKEPSVFVFQELTKQYVKYQEAAQKRNISEIKSQLLSYNNAVLLEKETFKNNFIANFSHEIKMPVETINGFVSLLQNTNLGQEQYYNLNLIKNTNDKLKVMINDILDISKIETGRFSILPIRYNLLEELNIIIKIYSQICKDKGLTLNYTIDPECPKYVIADKYRLAQIVNNLIGNAIKFTTQGHINLEAKCIKKDHNNATLEFSVTDTGIGIDNKKIDSIFNGFYQISNPLPNNGTGLGLAITRNLVSALGGTIEVTSKLEEGSTFAVTLDFEIAKNQEEDKTITKTSPTTANNDIKILLAEPLNRNQAELLEIIGTLKNCDVVIVENGDQIIEELYKATFNLVILNIKLPITDGIDTARFIRHSEYKQINKIPIVIVSDNPSKEEEHYCKQRKVNSYIGKPFDKPKVLRKLKYILKKKQAK